MSSFISVLAEIASTTKSKEKLSILECHKENKELKRCIEYAYNPEKIYGVVPDQSWIDRESIGIEDLDSTSYSLLDSLIARDLTGNAARDAIKKELNRLNESNADLFIRILRKDLRSGFSDSTANKIWKNLIPTYSYMRCITPKNAKFEKFSFKDGVFMQLKLDGLFANGNILESFQLTSRSGSVFPMGQFQNLTDEVPEEAKGHQIHGELLVEQDGVILSRDESNGIMNSVANGATLADNQVAVYYIWDIIPIECANKDGEDKTPYFERLAKLESLFKDTKDIRIVPYEVFYDLESCKRYAKDRIDEGKEGAVLKDRYMPWKHGTSKWQVKFKVNVCIDLKITGFYKGREDTKLQDRLAGIHLSSSDNKLRVNVVIKTDAMRDNIEKDPDLWIDKVVPVLANNWTPPQENRDTYSLFLGRLAEANYRTDKDTADTLEEIFEQFENPFEM
jgi:DNA ligase-1